MADREAHNIREQRRVHRVNDKIAQMRLFLEVRALCCDGSGSFSSPFTPKRLPRVDRRHKARRSGTTSTPFSTPRARSCSSYTISSWKWARRLGGRTQLLVWPLVFQACFAVSRPLSPKRAPTRVMPGFLLFGSSILRYIDIIYMHIRHMRPLR